MQPSEEQQAALERLREHESLTDNLTDPLAAALLAWAEQQILSGSEAGAVTKAVRAANRQAPETAEELLAVAQAALEAATTQAGPATAVRAIPQVEPLQNLTGPEPAGQQQQPPLDRAQPSPSPTAEFNQQRPPARSGWSRLRRWLLRRARSRR